MRRRRWGGCRDDFSLNTFRRRWAADATVMMVQIGLILQPLLKNQALDGTKKRRTKWGQTSCQQPEVETLILQTNRHLQSEPHSRSSLSNASAALRKTFFSSSITARPYLIHFKHRWLLWWIANVREIDNYYLDLAVFFGWPIPPQFLLGALVPLSISINCAHLSLFPSWWMKKTSC